MPCGDSFLWGPDPEFEGPDPNGVFRSVVPPGAGVLLGVATRGGRDYLRARLDPGYPAEGNSLCDDLIGVLTGVHLIRISDHNAYQVIQPDPMTRQLTCDLELFRSSRN